MRILPANTLQGEVEIPGDKSVSHRAAILGAMAIGETTIRNFSTSKDCLSTLGCLEGLGVRYRREGDTIFIEGVGKQGFKKPRGELNCGNSGTTMRILSGLLAGQDFDCVLTGDESLKKRPMNRIILPLSKMSAAIESAEGNAPLRISGRRTLKPILYNLPIASAQVKTAVLFAGLNGGGVTRVWEPVCKTVVSPSRDHTELMLRYLGAGIEEKFLDTEAGFVHEISIDGNSRLTGRDIEVPGDVSSAGFFIAASLVLRNSDVTIKNVGLNPTRTAFIEVLKNFGAAIEVSNERIANHEQVGDLRITESPKLANSDERIEIGGDIVANLIDEIPILGVLGARIKNGLEIRGAAEARVKESDRIAAVATNLKKMGAEVEEFRDGFRVSKSELKGARVDSFGDHRIAMAFAIAGLFAKGKTEILNSDCVDISFPNFFETLAGATN